MSPYLIAGIGALGIAIGAGAMHVLYDAPRLADEKAAHARDGEQCAVNARAVAAAAEKAASEAIAKQTAMQQAADAAQAQLAQERKDREQVDQRYRAAVSAGTERVRVAVRNCAANSAAGGGAVPDDSKSAGGSNDATTTADLDPALASRLFGVAQTDDAEIEKLRQLQAWACVVKPDAPACATQ
ncbi:hypothetical protein SAMN05216551_107127 [Chitinasiproducens palmae]|uniref:Lysozyme n=1 Tax=Chitinasiproducens palmae TaxID=1770053 RepID=A0A1H2PQQ4_9BURK|nr:hypothetical protein SAMN05216551_107127 [Chitinasiproducens palmae]